MPCDWLGASHASLLFIVTPSPFLAVAASASLATLSLLLLVCATLAGSSIWVGANQTSTQSGRRGFSPL